MAGIFSLLTMLSLASLLTEASVHILALYPTPPYAIDLNTTIPIHWTNGKTIANFIVSLLGLSFVPAYTNTSRVEISKTNVNYGHVGCGLLHQTDQIGQYNLTVANDLTKAFNEQELVQHLTSFVFLSSRVVNKMAPQEFAKILLNEMLTGLKTLYRLGARKFVVKNIWPLGCTPNFLIIPYNNSLPSMLNDLQSYLTGVAFSHSNDFQFVTDLMQNSKKYGMENYS
ncbi:hypothetical protein CsSME_00043408 [Camellia sinensis var. sinensis]